MGCGDPGFWARGCYQPVPSSVRNMCKVLSRPENLNISVACTLRILWIRVAFHVMPWRLVGHVDVDHVHSTRFLEICEKYAQLAQPFCASNLCHLFRAGLMIQNFAQYWSCANFGQ